MKELTPDPAPFESWSEEEKREYFWQASREFGISHARHDSVVRLVQEKLIAEDLDNGVPVLIRGNWRVGKTSMAQSLITHHYADNAIFIDTGMYAEKEKESAEEFKTIFGTEEIAELIVDQRYPEADKSLKFQKIRDLKNQLKENSRSPFEYLNEYMAKKGEKCFIAIDEVIAYAQKRSDLLEYLASLKDLPNVKLAIVLHRIQEHEEMFKSTFEGFKTHWIKSLPRQETVTLIQHGLSGTDIKFTENAIDEIQQFTGGRPWETNILCNMLLDPGSEYKVQKLVYSENDVKSITGLDGSMLMSLFNRTAVNYLTINKSAMSDEERELVDRIAIGDEMPEYFDEVIQGLIDTDIVFWDEKAGEYRIKGRLLEEVILNM